MPTDLLDQKLIQGIFSPKQKLGSVDRAEDFTQLRMIPEEEEKND
jgi:hypothetical protein